MKHFRSLAVLRGYNGLMWLAAKGALASLLLEHVVAASFAIKLLAASKPPLELFLLLLFGVSRFGIDNVHSRAL